eukprot:m.264556 g.264556  ORF g.264556 m.264556 type:complete len:55 (+) comp40471_c2_seq33:70-234(+)
MSRSSSLLGEEDTKEERKGVWKINTSSRMCSLHFTEESYYASETKRERKTACDF